MLENVSANHEVIYFIIKPIFYIHFILAKELAEKLFSHFEKA